MKHLGLLDNLKLKSVGLDSLDLLRYDDGSLLARRHVGSQKQIEIYGGQWWCVPPTLEDLLCLKGVHPGHHISCLRHTGRVVHRQDYHSVLLDAAIASGVVIKLGAFVCDLDLNTNMVELESGKKIHGDVIIGADGKTLQS